MTTVAEKQLTEKQRAFLENPFVGTVTVSSVFPRSVYLAGSNSGA